MAQFSLTWEAYNQSICSGLGALQQNGELVDMTLAADGHHVKVHQLVMSLVSPYIKELITSAQCSHPVIFLNKVSYTTLRLILEYIYSGEVHVTKENLAELVEAGKELHIKGLEEMEVDATSQSLISQATNKDSTEDVVGGSFQNEFENQMHQSYKSTEGKHKIYRMDKQRMPNFKLSKDTDIYGIKQKITHNDDSNVDDSFVQYFDDPMDHDTDNEDESRYNEQTETTDKFVAPPSIQYTTSNQGVIQLILNRYIYNLRYTSRLPSGHRQWRCVNYQRQKCQAGVISKGDVVVRRFAAHNHPFHDKKILKKVHDNAVYTAISEAENKSRQRREDSKAEKQKDFNKDSD